MSFGNLIVVGAVAATFIIFMVVLGVVAWWSNQAPAAGKTHTNVVAHPARDAAAAKGLSRASGG